MRVHIETYYAALHFLDTYIYKSDVMHRHKTLVLYANVCVYIAAKVKIPLCKQNHRKQTTNQSKGIWRCCRADSETNHFNHRNGSQTSTCYWTKAVICSRLGNEPSNTCTFILYLIKDINLTKVAMQWTLIDQLSLAEDLPDIDTKPFRKVRGSYSLLHRRHISTTSWIFRLYSFSSVDLGC
jgi:hypothetical protein